MEFSKYQMAYTQVLEIIKHFPKEDYEKIPKDLIKFYEDNKAKNYEFKIDNNKSLMEQEILKEANAILVKLFLDYFANDKQQNLINDILIDNGKIEERLKKRKNNN